MPTTFFIWAFFILYFELNRVDSLRTIDDETFWEPLIKEVVEAGGYIHPAVRLSYLTMGGLTVVATEDIPTDSLIMSIPQNITLKHEDIHREFPSWTNLPKLTLEIEVAPLSLYLAYHAISKRDSGVSLYVKYAPDTCMNGYVFEPDVVRMLDERAQNYFNDSIGDLHKEWNTIQNALKNGTIESDEIISSITFSTYKWATCVAYSRRYRRERGKGSLLIPLGDMFNHDTNYNSYWEYNNVTSSWNWKTSGVYKDNPVTINYGWTKENLELLFVYGFSVKENPNDKGHLRREVDDPIKDVIIDMYTDHYKYFMEYTTKGFSEKELEISRIAYLPQHQLTSYHISKLKSGDVIWPYERTLWDTLYRKCYNQMTIGIPGGSEEDDRLRLEETENIYYTKKSYVSKMYWETRISALQYRIYRRNFVRKVCGWIYKQLKRIGGGYD